MASDHDWYLCGELALYDREALAFEARERQLDLTAPSEL